VTNASKRAMSDTTEALTVVSASDAAALERDAADDNILRVPPHWRSPVDRNPFAAEAERAIRSWFVQLGCSESELARAHKFDIAGYLGIAFPRVSPELAVRIGKYLSIWLLWDDVDVESLENRWRIQLPDVLSGVRPRGSRFDHGWWQLFREFAGRRSVRWLEDLGAAMKRWSDAAVAEAAAMKRYRERGELPRFEEQIELRIATIGMYATVYLLEDEYDYELPPGFHSNLAVRRMKRLANLLVGLGNDLFSWGKDVSEHQINLVTTLVEQRGWSPQRALAHVISLHDRAVEEFDVLAEILTDMGDEFDGVVRRWIEDVRFASIGFTRWEAQAPRYVAHKVVVGNRVLEPVLSFEEACAYSWGAQ